MSYFGFPERDAERSEVTEHALGGHEIELLTWVTPADTPWDGDQPLEENAEGWDIWVEARLEGYRSGAQVAGNWIVPDRDGQRYLQEQVTEIQNEAVAALIEELREIANGRDVTSAQRLRDRAAQIVGPALRQNRMRSRVPRRPGLR